MSKKIAICYYLTKQKLKLFGISKTLTNNLTNNSANNLANNLTNKINL